MTALWSKLCLAVVGDDLHAAEVWRTPLGMRAGKGVVVERFLATTAEDARRALAPLVRRRQRVTLTIPSDWCAVRPLQMSRADWEGARDEVRRSLDRLLPIPADDAMLGFVELERESESEAVAGALIATRRSRVAPWLDAARRALGGPVNEVLSAHMALLGLGLQESPEAVVLDSDGASRHRLRRGKPLALDEPARDAEAESPSVRLPGAAGGAVSGGDLALAAGLAPLVASHVYAPFEGRSPSRAWRWAPVGLAAAAALALVATAGMVRDARLRAATERLGAEQAALVDEFAAAQSLRADTRRLRRLLEEGVAPATAGWGSALPALAEIHRAMPAEGFLYRVDISPGGIAFSGEAPSAPGVLRRLEDSPLLTAAQRGAPITQSSVSGMDVFELRASRLTEGGSP